MSTRDIGFLGEEQGLKYLKAQGYKILEKNFRTNFGEIDVIAEDGGYIVFVEIKLRGSDKFGTPAEAINASKQKKIVKSALQYIKANKLEKANFRFDAVVIGPDEHEIALIRDAFPSPGGFTL